MLRDGANRKLELLNKASYFKSRQKGGVAAVGSKSLTDFADVKVLLVFKGRLEKYL